VALSSDDATEGAVASPASPLTFTTTDWSTAQAVSVLGLDDDIADGDILYNIVLDPSSTGDAAYNALASVNVPVTNIDEDEVGFTITPTTGLLTSETGVPTATFDVTLNTIPTADVTLALSSSDTTEGTIDKPSLTFTIATWNVIQTVTITGVDDFLQDGDQAYTIDTGPVTSTDTDYGALLPADIEDVSVTNSDDDTAGYTVTPTTDLWTSEGQKTQKIQVLLKSRPTAIVTLTAVSSDPSEGVVEVVNGIVDPATWPQTTPTEIILTGVDDCDNTGDETYTLTISASSTDPDYNGAVGSPLLVTNYDAPTIGWVQPVGTEEIYLSDGISPIYLEVENLCNEPISRVRFYRWVVAINDNVTIGEDFSAPYQEVLQPSELEAGWNQVFAFAYGPPGPYQTFSKNVRILVREDYGFLINLPLMFKTP
jgi:hypothetical protein